MWSLKGFSFQKKITSNSLFDFHVLNFMYPNNSVDRLLIDVFCGKGEYIIVIPHLASFDTQLVLRISHNSANVHSLHPLKRALSKI